MPTKKTAAKLGRRPLPPGQKRENTLSLKFTDEERERIDRAARLDYDGSYNWGRRILLGAADARIAKAGEAVPSDPARRGSKSSP